MDFAYLEDRLKHARQAVRNAHRVTEESRPANPDEDYPAEIKSDLPAGHHAFEIPLPETDDTTRYKATAWGHSVYFGAYDEVTIIEIRPIGDKRFSVTLRPTNTPTGGVVLP